MIDFFFKKKEVVLDCFTYDQSIYTYAGICEAIKSIPEWFKKVPHKFDIQHDHLGKIAVPTVKTCYGILEYFRQSFVIPVFSDILIRTTKDDIFWEYFHPQENFITAHPSEQTNNSFQELFYHIKFSPPWQFRCKEDINFLFVNPFWNQCTGQANFDKMYVQHGIVNFKYLSHPNINVFIKKEDARVDLKYGDPFVQIFPLTDKKIKIVNHLVTKEEYSKITLSPPYTTLHRMKIAKETLKNE